MLMNAAGGSALECDSFMGFLMETAAVTSFKKYYYSC